MVIRLKRWSEALPRSFLLSKVIELNLESILICVLCKQNLYVTNFLYTLWISFLLDSILQFNLATRTLCVFHICQFWDEVLYPICCPDKAWGFISLLATNTVLNLCSWRACSVIQLCPTLCDPMNYSPLGSSVHGISKARILEWITISYSRESSQARDQTCVSSIFCIGRQIPYHWVTRGAGLYGRAAAAKSLQSCPTLCDPIDGSPPGSPIPGILQARTLEWVAIWGLQIWL